jgi:hypothetical protein
MGCEACVWFIWVDTPPVVRAQAQGRAGVSREQICMGGGGSALLYHASRAAELVRIRYIMANHLLIVVCRRGHNH